MNSAEPLRMPCRSSGSWLAACNWVFYQSASVGPASIASDRAGTGVNIQFLGRQRRGAAAAELVHMAKIALRAQCVAAASVLLMACVGACSSTRRPSRRRLSPLLRLSKPKPPIEAQGPAGAQQGSQGNPEQGQGPQQGAAGRCKAPGRCRALALAGWRPAPGCRAASGRGTAAGRRSAAECRSAPGAGPLQSAGAVAECQVRCRARARCRTSRRFPRRPASTSRRRRQAWASRPRQLNAPVLALTPAQITTLGSGNVTSINQLLGQLVSGNTSSQQLTASDQHHRDAADADGARAAAAALPPVSTPTPHRPSGRHRRSYADSRRLRRRRHLRSSYEPTDKASRT